MTTRHAIVLGAVVGSILAGEGLPAAAQDLPPGVFVGTPDGPQEVAVYAERTPGGRVKPPRMSVDDVQRVAGEVRFICNLPTWRLQTVWLSTARLFADDGAERRVLRTDLRQLSVSAVLARVPASGDAAEWRRLLAAVGASSDNPAYVFVTMHSAGMVRDFIVGVAGPSPPG